MKAIQACNPQSNSFLDPASLMVLIVNYELDHSLLSMEAKLAKRTLAPDIKDLQTISDVIMSLYPLRQAFPTLLKLLQIALTVCVTSAQCERCFSALKRIKTYLRSTMTEQRLVDLAILSVERDIAQQLEIDTVIDRFAYSDKNRRITLV